MLMTGALRHRGPDEFGIYLDDWVGLGSARLSIIDLETGTQPVHNEDKTLWIVYNGEVFNHPELRADLVSRGHRFYTTTDTEVILHLYEERGAACLDDLNGQFALAIWDARTKKLFLARDRVGILPLYYTVRNRELLFASEIKSLFMDRDVSRRLDAAGMNDVFTFWTNLPGKSAFENISELPPGHFLMAGDGTVTLKKYWDIPFCEPGEQLDWPAQRICEHVQELLCDAVRVRLRADVPVGCYVSGGLDSSGIASLIKNNFNSRVRTFGMRFEEGAFDEGEHQERAVSFLKTEHSELLAENAAIGKHLAETLWHCERPILRTAPVPLFLLSDLVRRSGFKVVLTGEGADEVFGGYNIFREAKVRRFWARQPGSQWRGLLVRRLYHYVFKTPRSQAMQQAFFATGLDQPESPFFSHQLRWQTTRRIRAFLSEDIRSGWDEAVSCSAIRSMLPAAFESWDYLSRAQYLEIILFMSNYLLSCQGDRVAMAHSVEIRVPYLDHRIIDFMGRVPAAMKIKGLDEKYILKKSFEGKLPKEITGRQKHPYRAPIAQSLMRGETKEYVCDMMSDGNLKRTGLFEPSRVGRLLNKALRSPELGEIDSMALVGILSAQIMDDLFIRNFDLKSAEPIIPNVVFDRRSARQATPT